MICEVGGTVGDIEGESFLEAIRQIRREEPRENRLSVHVTFLPYVGATRELKTKPTQHSVTMLRAKGIQPDVIIARSDHPVPREICDKIALFCDVDPQAVIPMETADSIYDVPLLLESSGLGDYVIQRFGLRGGRDLSEWKAMVERLKNPADSIEVAIVGKYVELHDAYMSVKESLAHSGIFNNTEVVIRWVHSEDLETKPVEAMLSGVQGIIVPGGFGERGWEGKIVAANYARVNQIPYLGLCLGMQVMVTEFARNVCDMPGANTTEIDPETQYPVISLLDEQQGVKAKGGTMRLGSYPCRLAPGTLAARSYGTDMVTERHRHRWEFNNFYRGKLEASGLLVSGASPDGSLVEITEIANHPFMIGSQFHPELQSRPNRPHPFFREFVAAAKNYANSLDSVNAVPVATG